MYYLLRPVISAGFNLIPTRSSFLSQKMVVAWNVPPNEEGEGRGRNVPHWQLKREGVCACVCGVEEVCSNRAPQHGLPLSLYLWWGFCSTTVANTEGLTLDWGHRCQEHKSTCSTTVSCFAITVQVVLIFLHFLWRIWMKFLFLLYVS